MKVRLMVEGQEGVTWPQWVALAEACEEAKLDGLFRSDHYFSVFRGQVRSCLDAWGTLAALAAVTDTIRLGTLVSPVTFRHPSELAKLVTTVDHVSGGRVELGMGTGWHEKEHDVYGFAFPDLGERFDELEEQLEIVTRQWTDEAFDFDGELYVLEDCRAEPKPVQQPRPPLIMGGQAGPRSLALAERFADEYNGLLMLVDDVAELRASVPAKLRLSIMATCVVGEDEADVARRLQNVMDTTGYELDASAKRLVGTVDQLVARLRELEAAGVERVYCQHLAHADTEMVRLLGDVARAVDSSI